MSKYLPFQIAGQSFNSYAQLEKKIEMILTLYNDKETLKKQDFSFILEVLKHHPQSETNVARIKSIVIKRNSKEKKLSFYFVNDDGQIKYFNYSKYLNEINRLEQMNDDQKSNGVLNMQKSFTLTFVGVILMVIFRIIPNLIIKFNLFLKNTQSSLQRFFRIEKKNIEMRSLIPHLQGEGQKKWVAIEGQLPGQSNEINQNQRTSKEKNYKKKK